MVLEIDLVTGHSGLQLAGFWGWLVWGGLRPDYGQHIDYICKLVGNFDPAQSPFTG